jgi:hypothetical protein
VPGHASRRERVRSRSRSAAARSCGAQGQRRRIGQRRPAASPPEECAHRRRRSACEGAGSSGQDASAAAATGDVCDVAHDAEHRARLNVGAGACTCRLGGRDRRRGATRGVSPIASRIAPTSRHILGVLAPVATSRRSIARRARWIGSGVRASRKGLPDGSTGSAPPLDESVDDRGACGTGADGDDG